MPAPAVTIPEACEILHVSRPTINRMLERGELTRYKVGRSVRLRRDEVLALIGGSDDSAA